MTKTNRAKRSLLMSGLALLLCISMLIGSTFAWFTDSVTSAGNIIKSGTLDVEMFWADGKEVPDDSANWIDASTGPIFEYDNWEPGYTVVRHIKIENIGSLALQYQLAILANGPVTDLTDVIDVYYADGATQVSGRDLTGMTKLGTLTDVLANMDNSASGNLIPAEDHTITLALKMQETAGNDYQYKSIGATFSVQLLATQLTYETDSFDDLYDEDTKYPMGQISSLEKSFDGYTATIEVPADAPAYDYELVISNYVYSADSSETTLSFDMKLVDENQQEIPAGGIEYTVQIQLPHPFVNMDNFKVLHNGEIVPNAIYDAASNSIYFTTSSFSPFQVIFENYVEDSAELDYAEQDGQYAIKGGTFVGVNPAEYDPSLAEADSEYIAINFEKNGETCYVVSERATTTVVAADDAADYVAINGNYSIATNSSGNLWKIISGLQNTEHSTVYLLPGTYNEGTTIGVYSSMDIIGLGDRDAVKVIKLSSSNSNRHLFNCSGTKADYIEVTIQNMYLDATATTTGSKDNAAVQSIRKSKVKCYDLTIVKGTGWDAIAFYVNGNNAVDGVKYPAYLYAENCALNTTRTFGVLSTAGTYKFNHYGLTYGGTAYTNNSGATKNLAMEPGDWDWEQ